MVSNLSFVSLFLHTMLLIRTFCLLSSKVFIMAFPISVCIILLRLVRGCCHPKGQLVHILEHQGLYVITVLCEALKVKMSCKEP